MLQHTYNLQQWLRNASSDFFLSKKNPNISSVLSDKKIESENLHDMKRGIYQRISMLYIDICIDCMIYCENVHIQVK